MEAREQWTEEARGTLFKSEADNFGGCAK
jgi:hypothetical protein